LYKIRLVKLSVCHARPEVLSVNLVRRNVLNVLLGEHRLKWLEQANVQIVPKGVTNQNRVQRHVWVVYLVSTNRNKNERIVQNALLGEHRIRSPEKNNAMFVPKDVTNQNQVQRHVWIVYPDNIKTKRNKQRVRTVPVVGTDQQTTKIGHNAYNAK
jgi:hypothetical protein